MMPKPVQMQVTRYGFVRNMGYTLWRYGVYPSRIRKGVHEAKVDGRWVPLRDGEFRWAKQCQCCGQFSPISEESK